MGKKRKPDGRRPQRPQAEELGSARRAITTYEDVADSEDEFYINRDKILLDDGPEKKQAFLEESDEEILDLDEGLDESSDPEYASESGADEFGKGSASKLLQERESSSVEPDEALDGWGTSKKEYYNADIIETEADALEEEAEALKLQQKHLKSMAEADFGFDETEWLNSGLPADDNQEGQEGITSEVLPDLRLMESMSAEEREEILRLRYPEFKPLADEYLELRGTHDRLMKTTSHARDTWEKSLAQANDDRLGGVDVVPTAITHFNALSVYLGCLAMYFAIFASGSSENGGAMPKPPKELREHPIMESLIKSRNLWQRVKDLKVDEAFSNGMRFVSGEKPTPRTASAFLSEKVNGPNHTTAILPGRKALRASKAHRMETHVADRDSDQAERKRKTEEEPSQLALGITTSVTEPRSKDPTITLAHDDSTSRTGSLLTSRGDAENSKRKKSLQFYTSQIAQKFNRRETAGRDAGGDADIPYRERLKDRQARLLAQAEARGKKHASAEEQLGGESDVEDRTAATQIRAADDGLDLYDQVANQTKQKKAEKAARSAARKEAEKQGASVRFVEEVDADGKRAIGYKIEKNKGLTPKRRKEVRNPRVKKRNKYEDKLKKLGSIRQVYKGGEGRGGYGGELTGIKTNLVRSVKF